MHDKGLGQSLACRWHSVKGRNIILISGKALQAQEAIL